ncbi:MAG: YabP/YqfC family sporulation protein [Bacillota bacterium]|jgi:sporulation protein YqfC
MRKTIKQGLSEVLDLPADVSLDLPRVVIHGHLGVLIQNHRGIMLCSGSTIVIGIGKGQITVLGQNLQVEEVSREDVVIRGIINSVQMET